MRRPPTLWDRCVDVTIEGVVNGIVAVYDQMIRQSRSHAANISSVRLVAYASR